MRKFSIITLFWGEFQALQKFIADNQKWTDDIVVINISLFYELNLQNVKVINLPFNFFWGHGYNDAWNLGMALCKHNFAYVLGTNKRIVEIDEEKFNQEGFIGYACKTVSEGEGGEIWVKMVNTQFVKWLGKIHEEPYPVTINEQALGKFCMDTVIKWERIGFTWDSQEWKLIADNFRLLTRYKWLWEINNGNFQEGTNGAWYDNTLADKNLINWLYNQIKYLFEIEKQEEFLKILSQINLGNVINNYNPGENPQ